MSVETMVSLIIGAVTIFIGIVGHICFSVWWASKITTTLGFVREDMKDLKGRQDGYMPKESAMKEFNDLQMKSSAVWKRIDEFRNMLDNIQKDLAFMKGEHK